MKDFVKNINQIRLYITSFCQEFLKFDLDKKEKKYLTALDKVIDSGLWETALFIVNDLSFTYPDVSKYYVCKTEIKTLLRDS